MMKPRANRGVKTSHPSTTAVAASPAQPHALLIVLPDQWIPSFHSLNAFVFALCFTHIPFPPSCFRACSPGLLLGRTSRLVPQRNTRMYCTASSSHSVLPPSPSPPRTVDTIVQEQTHTHTQTHISILLCLTSFIPFSAPMLVCPRRPRRAGQEHAIAFAYNPHRLRSSEITGPG